MTKEHYWKTALINSDIAAENGSLIPLKTKLILSNDYYHNDFELRELRSKFPINKESNGPKVNPFRPFDPRLNIADISSKHALILNKYPVQKGHMLLITKKWEPQSGWINISDFEALIEVDNDTSGLWFYNSGQNAGASQPHRHIQLLRRSTNEKVCPRDSWFIKNINNNIRVKDRLGSSLYIIKRSNDINISQANNLMMDYVDLCQKSDIGLVYCDEKPRLDYNLIITRDWMAIVRRKMEGLNGFSINSLGFAGYILSTNKSDMDWYKKHGPLELLLGVVK